MATTTKTTTMKLVLGWDAAGKPTMTISGPGSSSFPVSRQTPFRTHLDVMTKFHVDMKLLQTGGYMLPGRSVSVWFPNMLSSKNHPWTNHFTAKETKIVERRTRGVQAQGLVSGCRPVRITFAKLHRSGYSFVGIFEEDPKSSHPGITVYKRRDDILNIGFSLSITTI